MTARITAEEARALLDGTTPGPWRMDTYRLDAPILTMGLLPGVVRNAAAEILSTAAADIQLRCAAPDLAATVIALEEERDAIVADREALAMGVWSAVHQHADGMPPLDTPRDRAEVIAAVEGLRRERDDARTHERAASERARILRGTVRHVEEERDVARLLAQRARDDRHEAERRAILAEQARTEAVRERDEARAEVERMRANLASFAEVERLRAVVEGRTTPPTDAEVAAIVAEGGWWQCSTDDGEWGVSVCAHPSEARHLLRDAAEEGVTLRWWAHDRTGRPCAWPTVGGAQ